MDEMIKIKPVLDALRRIKKTGNPIYENIFIDGGWLHSTNGGSVAVKVRVKGGGIKDNIVDKTSLKPKRFEQPTLIGYVKEINKAFKIPPKSFLRRDCLENGHLKTVIAIAKAIGISEISINPKKRPLIFRGESDQYEMFAVVAPVYEAKDGDIAIKFISGKGWGHE